MKLLLCIAVIFGILSPAARGYDLATESTQVLNNIALLIENIRQLQSVYNQVEMIKNQVEELKSVANYQNNFNDIDSLRNNLTSITSQGAVLSNQTQALMTQMQQELKSLPASGTMIDQQESLDQSTLNVIQNALNRAAQLRQSYQQVVASVNALMNKNDGSVGQTQALQTSNELAAQNIAQTQSTQELLSEQISMQAAMMSKQLQEEKNKDENLKQIFNNTDDSNSTTDN